MKIYTYIALIGLTVYSITGFSQAAKVKIEDRNGIYYEVGSNVPYSGVIESHYDGGVVASSKTYKEGYLVKEISFFTSGLKAAEMSFEKGQRHGIFIEYYQNGKKSVEGTFYKGRIDGILTKYDKTGKVSTEEYRKGKRLN